MRSTANDRKRTGSVPARKGKSFASRTKNQQRQSGLLTTGVPLAIAGAIIIAGTARDALLLFRYPVAAGLDGYYYVLQLASLQRTGHLYYASHTPVAFWILQAVGTITASPVIAVKVTFLLVSASLAFAVSALSAIVADSALAAPVSAVVMSWTTLHLFLLSEFLKQGIAYVFLTLACIAFISLKTPALRIAITALFIVFSVLAHVSIWEWIAVIVCGEVLLRLLTAKRLNATLFLIASAAIMAIPCLLALLSFIQIPRLVSSNITASPIWPIASVGQAENLALLVLIPIMLAVLLSKRPVSAKQLHFYGIVSLFSMWITLNPFLQHRLGSNSVSVRMQDVAQIQLALLLPGILVLLSDRPRMRLIWSIIAVASVLALDPVVDKTPRGLTDTYLQERVQMSTALSLLRGKITAPVVAEHGDEFLATYYLGITSEHDLPHGRTWDRANWILREYPCSLDRAYVLDKTYDTRCIVLIEGEILPIQFRAMTRAEQIELIAHNPHLYFAFHRNEE